MRMVFVIITGLSLMGMITTAWYVSQTIVVTIATSMFGQIGSSSEGISLLNLVEFANIIWGPLFDGIIVFWMVASAQARDVESESYG